MKQQQFEQMHQQQWKQLERWLNEQDKPMRQRLPDMKGLIQNFPTLYRQVCQHLALARERHYSPYLQNRLNQLVLRGQQQLYQPADGFWRNLWEFLSTGLPQRVRSEKRLFLAASLLFYGPLLAFWMLAQWQEDLIYDVMGSEQVAEYEAMYEPSFSRIGRERESDTDMMMFGFYIQNNISIGFKTFATGLLLGLGSLFFLIYNGMVIGIIAGHMFKVGYSETFYTFVAGHSAFELTGIVLSGAAGLKLGIALIAPGRYSRKASLRRAAAQAMPLVYGMILLLALAAVVEAFWSSNALIPAPIKYSVGLFFWLFIAAYFIRAGRTHATG
ncbi:stage II sporulation protein M [Candidatus Venteria ishoeyi]|uniref:Stage II sporulation protein M n=1 Tax=Candidatus Venteria ishoeyi TaxID=1899563 RepID=A0A1H6FCZ1_9GAMM|nr:stage II sporulation protein M [Candidatus Venteria ishoeyi]MDM8547354.1 stage II sporulation protein M [Candidatus Venteria ishoeyi]SEH07503.1 Uncharacterised protein [Candidatus Venteria ishoeyi]